MALGLSVRLSGKLRNPNRHKDMPQKKEKLALPPSAITTLLQSSPPTRKENLCQQQPVLSYSRTKKTAAASSSQQANLSFLFRDKTGLFLVCRYNRFQQPFALLVYSLKPTP